MTNIEQYINNNKNCFLSSTINTDQGINIPKRLSEYLLYDNFLSEFNTEQERKIVMLNILLMDNIPTENSTNLVNSGTVYKLMREGKLERDQLTELINNLYRIKADKDELFSKKYTDLTDVPTKLSLFTNDSGYVTLNLLLNSLEEILEDFVSDEFVTKDELGDYITREELFDMLNPFKITISVNPNFLERTGEIENITITVVPRKGNLEVTPDTCQISYGGNTYNFTGSYIAQVSLSTSFTVTCTYKSETSSASGSVSFVYPSYFGFAETSDFNSVDTSQLAKDIRASILCTKTLNNTVAGSYLWIVTPYSLNTVATDPGYTYKVAMVLAGNKNNLNYYRSNSAIDVSNLTYYIK